MPRGPRLDKVGAVHHVMARARGIERWKIFLDDADREDLVGWLTALVPATGSVVCAWSMLPNHFHLLLRSGAPGLSVLMRRLQTWYAVAFKQRHRRSGHMFQNRFEPVWFAACANWTTMPAFAGHRPLRRATAWTGHAVILGHREAVFQDKDLVLSRFGRRASFVGGGNEGKRTSECWLGSSEFVLAIQKAEEEERDAGAVRRLRSLAEQQDLLERLVVQVAWAFGVAAGELQAGSRRQAVVAARAALVWLGKGHQLDDLRPKFF